MDQNLTDPDFAPQEAPEDGHSREQERLTCLTHTFNDFGFRLYHELSKEENAFFSPLSMSLALSALVPGVRGECLRELTSAVLEAKAPRPGHSPEVRDEISLEDFPGTVGNLYPRLARCRGLDWVFDETTGEGHDVERDFFRLCLANGLFVQDGYSLLPSYRKALDESFDAEIYSLDFDDAEGSAAKVNHWISLKTEGKIPALVPASAIQPDTRLILTNAVFFLAQWAEQFDRDLTEREIFHRLPGHPSPQVEVPMMRQEAYLPYWSDPHMDLQALEIPYRAMTMLVLLPGEGSFESVDGSLDPVTLNRIVEEMEGHDVDLKLPRFELQGSYELTDALQSLGIRSLFDPESADFSGMTDDAAGLVLSGVIHDARVKVDEDGTEAAAATAMMHALGAPPEEIELDIVPFHVDRPFFFLIRDEQTGSILFFGRVTDPA